MLEVISSRLAAIEQHLGLKTGATDSQGAVDPPSIKALDDYCLSSVVPFTAACAKLGGDADKVAKLVTEAFAELRSFLLLASACKEPPQTELNGLLAGMGAKVKAISAAVNRNEWEKHTKTVSEGIGCLNWVVIKPAPCDFIDSFVGGSDYWANNIRREFRTTNPDQIAFCDTFKALLLELKAYVKAFHTTGTSWNPRGVDVAAYQANPEASATPTVPTNSSPTLPSASPATTSSSSTGAKVPTVDLFAALNKGGNITAGLKTVTRDQQTWRSEYKAETPVPAAKAAPVAKTGSTAESVKGTPKLEFLSAPNKWLVEYQSGPVTVTIGSIKETVYILGCIGATIVISGKCKSIIVDMCKKTKVVFDNVMASCEVVNCQRMHIQCSEKVSSVAIDKTDGIIVQLPLSSMDSTIVASKSSEMNVQWPDANGDILERPIPEQYVHRIKGLSITAEVSDLYGH